MSSRRLLSCLAAITLVSVSTASFASDAQSAGQDLKDASHSVSSATKKSATSVKKGVKKGTHKTAAKVDQGAKKVENKTE